MDDLSNTLEHPKKRRRRIADRPAVSARLILDETLRGDTGFLSYDIYTQLLVQTSSDSGKSGMLLRFY